MTYFKKIFSAVLCMILLCNCTAFAQESEKYDIEATATVLNNIVTVNISIEAEEIKGVVCAALIDGDITCATITEQAEENLSLTFPQGKTGDKVKIFLWENILTLKPLCEARVVAVEADPILASPLYGKKLYVDGDSICYGNGYKGGYGKIIADKYGMKLVNNGVGGATICSGVCHNVPYGTQMDWDSNQYYLKLTHYDPENPYEGSEYMDGFAFPITKDIYENGFGVYPTLYKLVDGVLTALAYTEVLPQGKHYVRFDVPTYDGNTVPKYFICSYWNTNGNITGNHWIWEAYKSGFKTAHETVIAGPNYIIGTAKHWLSHSVEDIDTTADYIIFEGGVNDYGGNRRLGKLTEDVTGEVDTTTVIGGMEYICRQLITKCVGKKILYVITHKDKNKPWTKNRLGGVRDYKTLTEYHDAIVSVLEKYDIDYVDLFETEFDTAKEEYLQYTVNKDGVHPTKEGYEKFFVPHIVEKMENCNPIRRVLLDTILNFEQPGTMGGYAGQFAVENNFVYLCRQGFVYKIDVSDINNPVVVKQTYYSKDVSARTATGVQINGDYIYIGNRLAKAAYPTVDEEENLLAGAFAVLKKEDLSVVSVTPLGQKVSGMSLYKNLLIVNLQMLGWSIYDVTDARNPIMLERVVYERGKSYETQGGEIFEHEGKVYYAVAGFGDGIRMYDITEFAQYVENPSAFEAVPEIENDNLLWLYPFYGNGIGGNHTYDLTVKYPYVYATIAAVKSQKDNPERIQGILTFDITDVNKKPQSHTLSLIAVEDKNEMYTGSDTEPSIICRLNDTLVVNNDRKGIAFFSIEETPHKPEYVGTYNPFEGSCVYRMVFDEKGRLFLTDGSGSGDNPKIYIVEGF